MNTNERLALIEAFERGAAAFDDLPALKQNLRNYRPQPDFWTIHEQVVHVAESEIAAFHRYRKAIAEPGSQVLGYDEELWTPSAGLDYSHENIQDWISFFKLMRRLAAGHLRRIAEQDWSQYAYVHNSFGRVGLEDWVRSYIDHVKTHRSMIDRNIAAWKAREGAQL